MDINIKNLVKDFGSKRAVDIDRYTVKSGEMIGLVGNNGAGKTTLFRLILDLLKRDEGDITIGEWSVNETELWKNYTGTFIDDSFLIDYLTPEEFFYFVGKMYNISKSSIDDKLEKFTRFKIGRASCRERV